MRACAPRPGTENMLGMNTKPLVRNVSQSIRGLTPEISQIYMDLNMRVVGSKCDCCNVTASAERKLLLCTRCKRKKYCCIACQHADWKKHKLSCRAPKDFKINDIVRVQGIIQLPELNGNLVSVVEITDRLVVVVVLGGTQEFKVESSNITLIVPVNERLDI